ncbi:probable sugar phosphate/phosphate translocator [Tanacetum coccineum]|uniref:Probable sugar phosphate/phosphate translocator n=1 Tax=Tanacetum coccineum TaxID=301880 RepID=A0ABQ5D534_9ASTR
MNGSSSTELAPALSPRRANINEKRVSFDIENDSDGESKYPNTNYVDNKVALASSKNPIVVADILKTLFFILVWYTFSTFLTVYNKVLLGDHMGKFPAPLLMNTIHFSMQAVFSNAVTYIWSKRFQPTVTMSWKDYFMRVVPTALGTALDINLSNASLVFITVTFATMCKSAAPIFLLIFAFAFRLESPSFKLLGIMLIISAGVLLTVARETEFDLLGFIFVMLSAVMSGFRWSMTQILLQVLTEYILVSVTSAVTVTIAGVVKEAVTILVAVFYFHDEFTWLKGAGLVTIMFGVSLFNWYKYQKLHTEKLGVDELPGSQTAIPAKYVILEEVDDEETSPR